MTGFLAGCSSSDDVVYHEMTSQELAELQAEDTLPVTQNKMTDTAASPDQSEQPSKQTDLTASTSDMQKKKGTQTSSDNAPVKSSASNTNSSKDKTEKKSDSSGKQKPGKAAQTVATASNKTSSASPLNASPNLKRPGMLPGDKLVELEKRVPKLLIPDKTFPKEEGEDEIRVSFDDIDLLKVLNMEPVPEDALEMFPTWLSGLEGRRVHIRGFMFPTLSQSGITYFQHVRDNEICCFGRTPKVYDRISTLLKEGETTEYIQGRPFDVVGTLRIDPIYEDGEWLQLYVLEDAIVLDD